MNIRISDNDVKPQKKKSIGDLCVFHCSAAVHPCLMYVDLYFGNSCHGFSDSM